MKWSRGVSLTWPRAINLTWGEGVNLRGFSTQALELKNLNKRNKDLLNVTIANNKEYKIIQAKLDKQIESAKKIAEKSDKIKSEILLQQKLQADNQESILDNQRREIQKSETQKFLKAQVFNIDSLIDYAEKITESDIIKYFILNNLSDIKNIITDAKNNLIEIPDKQYCNSIISKIEFKFKDNQLLYDDEIFSEFSLKLNEYNNSIHTEKVLNKIVRDENINKSKEENAKSAEFTMKITSETTQLEKQIKDINSKISNSKFYKVFRLLIFIVAVFFGFIMTIAPNRDSLTIYIILFFLVIVLICAYFELRHRKIKGARIEKIKTIEEIKNNLPKEISLNSVPTENKIKFDQIRIKLEKDKEDMAIIIEKIKTKYPTFFKLQSEIVRLTT